MAEYEVFKSKAGIELPVYIPHTLEDLVSSINSCKLFIGNTSSPLTIAYALHKKNITLIDPISCVWKLFYNMESVIKNREIYTDIRQLSS